jgi:hypothetical protein
MPDFGTLEFTIPYGTGQTVQQDYINYFDSGLYEDLSDIGSRPVEPYPYTSYTESYSGFTGITYYNAIGLSKVSELKKYGSNEYVGITINPDNTTGYTIDGVYYQDNPEGFTIITGNTVGFKKEEVIFEVLSRNEHFLGFVEEPTIYSDVYVDRGKQSVMEINLRLGEVDNIGELSNYGNGYFKVKKQ